MAEGKSSIGIRVIMNMPNELHDKLEDYRVLKRKLLGTTVPKTSEAIIDLMILGLIKLEETLDGNFDTNIKNDVLFNNKIQELTKFKA